MEPKSKWVSHTLIIMASEGQQSKIMMFEAINSTFFTPKPTSSPARFFFFKLDLKWVFYSKKVEFMASNIIIWTKFLIGTPLGPIGLGSPTQIEGGQISWLLPSELPFLIFFWVFLAWMPWNISTSNGWKPGSHCSQKKSKNATLNFLDFFFSFFSFFFKRP